MPSLFAYLIAVGLLLGGGYGALTWLAAPEPVKIAAKAKPIPRLHFDEANREAASEPSGHEPQTASLGTTSLGTTSLGTTSIGATSPETVGQSRQVAVGSNQPPVAPPAEVNTASTAPGARAKASGPAQTQSSAPAQVQQNPAVSAEVPSAEIAPPERAQPAEAASTGNHATAVSAAPAATAKTMKPKRPHQRLASRSERPALALMTLRTIEFPDGHRVTQLLPYRGDDRD
jgi:hypothetical protein